MNSKNNRTNKIIKKDNVLQLAEAVHVQRMRQLLDLRPFLTQVKNELSIKVDMTACNESNNEHFQFIRTSLSEEDFQKMLRSHHWDRKTRKRLYEKVDYYVKCYNLFKNDEELDLPYAKRKKKRKTKIRFSSNENVNFDFLRIWEQSEYEKHAVVIRRRQKLWMAMCKKELGKVHRARSAKHKDVLQTCKRIAQLCMKACRHKIVQTQKNTKDTIWRCKRLTKEMQVYWKKNERIERNRRLRKKKEIEDQHREHLEMVDIKREQRKVNFLIKQTELYAHFISTKVASSTQIDEKNALATCFDDYNNESFKLKEIDSQSNSKKVSNSGLVYTKLNYAVFDNVDLLANIPEEYSQPRLFNGHLKAYQLKGLNWLANLYSQGINGILADEMGLGKTIQTIAFLCHLVETYSQWGPFLIISPASTLHNWQQEISRFAPNFRVIPYWGAPNERKILRQFWQDKDFLTYNDNFHVVITSYQIIVSDFKYFNKIKWKYMVLDEAQAVKNPASNRWKLLSKFSCKNRLLLTGTPIQNNLAELWALLHFIMPKLFDSHDEFNKWFSKDIENYIENKIGVDEKHLTRLRMILKPFMLRRVKKDVENELLEKIEIILHCSLTGRQQFFIDRLKKKIVIEDLLNDPENNRETRTDDNYRSNLMNLVMQFRKVCNHPELFERRDVISPLFSPTLECNIQRKLMHNLQVNEKYLLYEKFSLWTTENIYRLQFKNLSFIRFILLSPEELSNIFTYGVPYIMKYYIIMQGMLSNVNFFIEWKEEKDDSKCLVKNMLQINSCTCTKYPRISTSNIFQNLIFTQALIDLSQTYCEDASLNKNSNESTLENLRPSMLYVYNPSVIALNLLSENLNSTLCNHKFYNEFKKVELCALKSIQHESFFCVNCMLALIGISRSSRGWFNIVFPDKEKLVVDSGKLRILDSLLKRLKEENHRILIYTQMTKMIDLLELYMCYRKYKYMRLDGSSKISERRNMVADFQAQKDIFVFLLSTRAGGIGINLTAADTVIFYDSDWNPTVDQQAMDRAHRLGQIKQVTVYRLICKNTIEDKILQKAREKNEIGRIVISNNSKLNALDSNDMISLLIEDEEIKNKYYQKHKDRKRTHLLNQYNTDENGLLRIKFKRCRRK